jgi:putative aldouronate transport system permease protein
MLIQKTERTARGPAKTRKDFSKRMNVFGHEMRNNWQMYIMGVPAIVMFVLFNYMPMAGIIIAFKNFNFKKGIFLSPWAQPLFKNFEVVVGNAQAWAAIRNTVLLNVLFIASGTIAALALAIMINEIRNKPYRRITQSLTFLPFFISWVVVGLFATFILDYDNGLINHFLASLGFQKIMFFQTPGVWPIILMVVSIWKGVGYSAVIYLATMSGFSEEYYEAARIDGASRLQEIMKITLPLLYPTVIILTLLAVGNIMRADFGMFFFTTNDIGALYPTTDVIDTFVYRGLRVTGNISISSATGMFQSVTSLFFVLVFNWIANRYQEGYGLF